MPLTARELVDSKLNASPPDPDARPTTPEPTTASVSIASSIRVCNGSTNDCLRIQGVEPENALFDNSPSNGARSAEWRSGRRQRRSTERGELYGTFFYIAYFELPTDRLSL